MYFVSNRMLSTKLQYLSVVQVNLWLDTSISLDCVKVDKKKKKSAHVCLNQNATNKEFIILASENLARTCVPDICHLKL